MNAEDTKIVVGILLIVGIVVIFVFFVPSEVKCDWKEVVMWVPAFDHKFDAVIVEDIEPIVDNSIDFGIVLGVPTVLIVTGLLAYFMYQRQTEG